MDAKTLGALKASIAKWERNAKAETPDTYLTAVRDCPLCDLFYDNHNCVGCPVSERTKQSVCDGSPYEAASRARYRWLDAPSDDACLNAREAARAEVAFLKSLLPASLQQSGVE